MFDSKTVIGGLLRGKLRQTRRAHKDILLYQGEINITPHVHANIYLLNLLKMKYCQDITPNNYSINKNLLVSCRAGQLLENIKGATH